MVLLMDMTLEAGDARPLWFAESQLIPHLLLLQDWARDTTATVLAALTALLA